MSAISGAPRGPLSLNLLPRPLREARQRRRIGRRGAAVAGAYLAMLALALAVYAAQPAATGIDPAGLAALRRDRDLARASVAGDRGRLLVRAGQLAARRQVLEQPPWDQLLRVVAAQCGRNIALRGLALEESSGGQQGTSRSGRAYRLSLRGVGRDFPESSAFVLRLERTGVFTGVRLVGTTREPLPGGEAVGFEVLCTLAGE